MRGLSFTFAFCLTSFFSCPSETVDSRKKLVQEALDSIIQIVKQHETDRKGDADATEAEKNSIESLVKSMEEEKNLLEADAEKKDTEADNDKSPKIKQDDDSDEALESRVYVGSLIDRSFQAPDVIVHHNYPIPFVQPEPDSYEQPLARPIPSLSVADPNTAVNGGIVI
uniref:Uncharacterized protein n=1 Tax=Chromera velia CCMP2878 TaxID=1169474 RepID=A0A0G4HK30_9ALVE|mmetsp:Transcript_19432/g.39103  ORF Transcript_19432/g.39103 Transcript_19432/m.39103 type:complete len:169 (-) Transcript_19432:26-532(-)|eukprot:Cvel_28469.t1-p1 / transcript=Cvel_28469.t1 / gene=Cvel_28469 / organism=Chromera_velia_CCMP2878 / gene_product=hypothetical protein / transcript_product=hypothetical protein / location=Cvel_scaffold3733:4295-4798(-) / protein_length=168 / sequence_SO=supercontig / SO=protein_coding / is_pseudo=false